MLLVHKRPPVLHDFGTPCPKRVCLAAVEDGIAQTLVGALHVLASTTALLNPKP